jgi:hypothetical protein
MPRRNNLSCYDGLRHHFYNYSKYKNAEWTPIAGGKVRKLLPSELENWKHYFSWLIEGIEPPKDSPIAYRCSKRPKGL